MAPRPSVKLRPGHERGLLRGLPWVYENQVDWTDAARALPPGTLVDLLDATGTALATAALEPGVPIALRRWAEPGVAIDQALLQRRLGAALALRERLYEAPFYRLVHADADGLPGVVIDRFGDILVLQLGAVAKGVGAALIDALRARLSPVSLLVRGLPDHDTIGEPLPALLELPEHGVRYLMDPTGGQKTGWYFDQRPHRAFTARCARGARVLDAFCYTGGFALQAALGGAREVLAMDRSRAALELAARSAALNGLEDRVRFERAELLEALPALAQRGERFDLIVCDPPPLAKHRGKRGAALQAQRHLARSAADLLEPGGILIQASCSHAVAGERFTKTLLNGLADAGRTGVVIHRGGAGPDHPVHPRLPQSAYLDVVGLRLD
jgi:23S rRNA (cytosine1962-C5)-methyltransferase